MLESELAILIRTVLLDGFTARGFPDVLIKQNYQMRQQGVPTVATVFMHHLGSHRVGSPKLTNLVVGDTLNLVTTEIFKCTYQIAALSPQSPATPTAPTTADLVEIASSILQHSAALQTFLQNKVGTLRITDINVLRFQDEKGQFEENPTFEVDYQRVAEFTTPVGAIENDVAARVFTF